MDFFTIRSGQSLTSEALFDSIARLFPAFPPTDKEARILDPFAATGKVIAHLGQAWGMKPYAIENYYGHHRALKATLPGAVIAEQISQAMVTPKSFVLSYNYPPYDANSPLAELNMLRSVYGWMQRGGYMLNVVFQNKLTQTREMLEWMWRVSENVDVFHMDTPVEGYALYLCVCKLGDHPRYLSNVPDGPFNRFMRDYWWAENNPTETRQLPIFDEEGFQSGSYDTLFVKLRTTRDADGNVTRIGPTNADEQSFGPSRLAQATINFILSGDVPALSAQSDQAPIYPWPTKLLSTKSGHITFRPREISEEVKVQSVIDEGVHLDIGDLFKPVGEPTKLRPPLTPRRSQSGIVIASGALGDAIHVQGEEHEVLVRAKTQYITKSVNFQTIKDEQTGETRKTIETFKNLPTTSITTIDDRGVVSSIKDDDLLEAFVSVHGEALMDFMETEFPPIYDLDNDPRFEYFRQFIDLVRIRGELNLAPTQMKIVAAIVSSFMEMKGLILEGEMGVGKSIMAATVAHLMRSIAYDYKYSLRQLRKDKAHKAVLWPGEVVLMLVPPTTATDENWLGEFALSIPNCAVFLGINMDDVNACLASCDESKQALQRIRDNGGTDEDWGIASRLNVLVVPESTAKEDEGWIHSPKWVRKFKRDSSRRVAVETVAINPNDGSKLFRPTRGSSVPLEPGDLEVAEDGGGKGEKMVRGGRNTLVNKYPGDADKIAQAAEEYVTKKLRYDQRIANRFWGEAVVSEESQTHEKIKRLYPRLNELGEVQLDYAGRVIKDEQTDFRHPVDQAMMDVREDRKMHDASHPRTTAIWQQRRGASSLERLNKSDYRQKLKDMIDTEEVIEARRQRIMEKYPRVDADYWAKGGPIMPLPDIVADKLPEAEWLIGVSEDWTNGRSMSLAAVILKKFRNRVGLFVADELHQYKNITAQRAMMMTRMANAARNALGLTGTLFGGTANTVFLLLYIFSEDIRREYPDMMSSATQDRWQAEMGVTEFTVTTNYIDADGDPAENPVAKRSEARPAPGAAPRLVKAAIPCTIRFSMKDMGVALPPFTQIPVPIPMDPDERILYGATEDRVESYDEQARNEGDYAFGMAKFQGLMGLVNAWWRGRDFWHRNTWDQRKWDNYLGGRRETDLDPNQDWVKDDHGKKLRNKVHVRRLVTRVPAFGDTRLSSKERWMIRMVNGEIAQGRGIAIYVAQSDTYDIRPRLESLIKIHCPDAKPFTLGSSVDSRKRAGHINAQASRGYNVMITNAKLVEVGLNLLAYPTIVFYEIHYSLYVMAQACRRAWRLSQTKACRVYYPYYVKTDDPEEAKNLTPVMEQRAMNVVAKKERTAAFMRGDRLSGLSQLAMDDGEEDLQKYAARMMEMGGSQSAFAESTQAAFNDASVNAEQDHPLTYMEAITTEDILREQPGDGERAPLTQEELDMPIEDLLSGLLDTGVEVTILEPERHEIEHLLPDEAVRALYYEAFGGDALLETHLNQLRYAVRLYDGRQEDIGAALQEIIEMHSVTVEEGNPMSEPVQQIGSALPDDLIMDATDLIGDMLSEVEPVDVPANVEYVAAPVDHAEDDQIVAGLLARHEAEVDPPVEGPRFAATTEVIITRYIAEEGETCEVTIPRGTVMQIDEEWEDEATLMDGTGFIIWVKPEQYEELYNVGPILPEQLEPVLQWMQVIPVLPEVRIRFDYRIVWGEFIATFAPKDQNRVKLIFAEIANYGGVNVNRRTFVEKSCAAVAVVSDGPEGYRLGEFSTSKGEAAYARFIYRHLPEYQQIVDGDALAVTPFPEGLTHAEILSYAR